jgi:integrase
MPGNFLTKVVLLDYLRESLMKSHGKLLTLCFHIAFAGSMRYGEISGLRWKDVFIDDESIKNKNARIVINTELARLEIRAMEALKDKEIIFKFPCHKPNPTTRLVLTTPKTESSIRTVWLPTAVAILMQKHKKEQDEMKLYMGDAYTDYDLVLAHDNGFPVENRIINKRLQKLCDEHKLETVSFHSLRHLSTYYKLKLTGNDVKSVQGDTGHAEADMVLKVYRELKMRTGETTRSK